MAGRVAGYRRDAARATTDTVQEPRRTARDPIPCSLRAARESDDETLRRRIALSLLRFLGLHTSPGRDPEPQSLVEIGRQLDGAAPEEARLVAAFAYLLARVASADLRTDAVEQQEMKRRLEEIAGVEGERAELLATSAVRAAGSHSASDDYLVARAFRDMADHGEKLRLLRCLYAVAAADEHISGQEDNEIFEIASQLGLAHSDVIALRSEFRAHLGSLKKLPGER